MTRKPREREREKRPSPCISLGHSGQDPVAYRDGYILRSGSGGLPVRGCLIGRLASWYAIQACLPASASSVRVSRLGSRRRLSVVHAHRPGYVLRTRPGFDETRIQISSPPSVGRAQIPTRLNKSRESLSRARRRNVCRISNTIREDAIARRPFVQTIPCLSLAIWGPS